VSDNPEHNLTLATINPLQTLEDRGMGSSAIVWALLFGYIRKSDGKRLRWESGSLLASALALNGGTAASAQRAMATQAFCVKHRIVALLLLACVARTGAEPARPVMRALLVGVSSYPTLDATLQLAGPLHDVALMRQLLLERGVPAANIHVLADGVSGAGLPTRRAILDELDRLGRDSRRGEQVVVYMAGHGSQQPAEPAAAGQPEAEADGLAEIFLPIDVGRWQPRVGRPGGLVENAIVDRELRERIDRIGASGAAVWAIFDACHANTLVRGGGSDSEVLAPDFRWRRVRPDALGVPRGAVTSRASASAPRPARRPVPPPNAVYFYASQSTEQTPELKLPLRSRDAVPHGLFTYVLATSLAGGATMTYRQLQQEILVRYDTIQDGAGVTPQFGGDGLDQPVLGGAAQPARQWLVRGDGSRLTLAAGQLAELQPGALLAVLSTPAAPLSSALGYVRVESATAATAQLLPVAHGGLRQATVAQLQRGVVARLVLPSLSFRLGVAVDLAGCARPCPYAGPIARLREGAPDAVHWVDGSGAELRLVAVDTRLWFLPASVGQRPCTAGAAAERQACATRFSRQSPSLLAEPGAEAGTIAEAVSQSLQSIVRVKQLLHNAAANGLTAPAPFDPEITFTRGGAVIQRPLGGGLLQLIEGDNVHVRWRNRSATPVDVTALYIDARYGIQALYPPKGATTRLEPGAEAGATLELETADSDGLERLVLIAVPARRHEERHDSSGLAQPALPREQVLRGDAVDGSTVRVVMWRLVR
jgi:hypothetical protein